VVDVGEREVGELASAELRQNVALNHASIVALRARPFTRQVVLKVAGAER
jgi:hypothetical protein